MATFNVKTFNQLSGKGQDGDIAIIERADTNGNQGFSFRNASGWSLPFVQVRSLGTNLMTTNTPQSVSAQKTFQGEVVINDDFSVIGATDIDLGFTGEFDITGNDEVGSQFTVSLTETITLTSSDGGTTLGSTSGTDFSSIEIEPTSVDITTDNLNANVGVDTSITSPAITFERVDGTTKGKITFDDFVSDVPSIEMFQAVGFETGYVSARKNEVTEEVFCNLFVRNTNTGQSTTVDVRSDFVEINGLSTSPAGSMTLKVGAFSVQLNDIPTYADNATALADLYPVDGLYKTATGELRIVV